MIGLIGKKIGMTQIFDENGDVLPVTVIQAGPCKIICKRTLEKNGYEAWQLGFEEVPERKVSKPMQGHFKKHGTPFYRHISEFRPRYGQEIDDYETGAELKADLFEPGETVTVTAKSKGRGFAGVVKRHGFKTAISSHGSHESFRGTGAIGMSATPGRVFKGKKMPGQHGNVQVTTRHLDVVKVDAERNLVMVKGAVPGHRNSIVLLYKE